MCQCLQLTIDAGTTGVQTTIASAGGTYNGVNYWTFTYDTYTIVIWSTGSFWIASPVLGDASGTQTRYAPSPIGDCPETSLGSPVNTFWINAGTITDLKTFTTLGVPCPDDTNCENQDRTFRDYGSIKLPEIVQEQDRGLKECCCVYKVLGDTAKTDWKNDLSSAWIKLSAVSDTATFRLKKNGVVATYTPTSVPFPNEENAFYTTVDWGDVITSDGVGCYTIEIEYSISGITGTIVWGTYDLEAYSISNALNTARIRAIFNGYQEIEQINFTGADVQSTFRFFGYIGNRQPNTEIDNIIYDNREMKRVIRENLNSYQLITDPSDDCIIRPLVDLYLLSENQLFISDYNAHNPSYFIQDLPVIVEESPELEYYDFSRKVKLTCTLSDKFKNKRTYY